MPGEYYSQMKSCFPTEKLTYFPQKCAVQEHAVTPPSGLYTAFVFLLLLFLFLIRWPIYCSMLTTKRSTMETLTSSLPNRQETLLCA